MTIFGSIIIIIFSIKFTNKNDKKIAGKVIISCNLEAEYNDKIQHLTENHKKKFDEFKSSIEQTEQSVDSFNSFLEKVLNEE